MTVHSRRRGGRPRLRLARFSSCRAGKKRPAAVVVTMPAGDNGARRVADVAINRMAATTNLRKQAAMCVLWPSRASIGGRYRSVA